jgi:hypothetical protein
MNRLEVAKSVAKLVSDPTNMRKWRRHVTRMLTMIRDHEQKTRGKNNHPWPFEPHREINTTKDVSALYTILALCHDDMLRLDCIITDEMKRIYPRLCSYPDNCTYYRRGLDTRLDLYLLHVRRNLGAKKKRQVQRPKKTKARSSKNIKHRFSFAPGQVCFDGKDLRLPTGLAIEVLEKLFEKFGTSVSYRELGSQTSGAADDKLRRAVKAVRDSLNAGGVPCQIETKYREGYRISEVSTGKRRHKRATKRPR